MTSEERLAELDAKLDNLEALLELQSAINTKLLDATGVLLIRVNQLETAVSQKQQAPTLIGIH